MNNACGTAHVPLDILLDAKLFNAGKLAEQFIAQHLAWLGEVNRRPLLTYWLREGRSTNAEVDFVVQRDADIVPIEVKAGKSGTLRSLQQFMLAKSSRCAVRFDMNPPTLIEAPIVGKERTYRLLSLPVYMVEEMGRLVQSVVSQATLESVGEKAR